ncbi:hypothetical protein MFMK1_002729 [Metallumcola ferriviriculae]|uniref:Uncharacterized protein n=1 Tax=Metallumcola ferriviriculae TaxID=3039180 RepID=A0AAU0UP51_9FIRM|nr:hypothetical protein MFMK1_002729 [Desulfitibacteraceae bacterium MK1]
MTDWNLAVKVFFSGIAGVFMVMVVLQISIAVTYRVVKLIESSTKAEEKKSQAS